MSLAQTATAHFHYTVEGRDVDKLDFVAWLDSQPEGTDIKLSSGNTNIYFYPPKNDKS